MTILSDSKILASIYGKDFQIEPLQVDNIQPSSIDLTLDNNIKVPIAGTRISPPYPTSAELGSQYFTQENLDGEYILRPNCFIIAQISETISLSNKLVGSIQNRNSLIRLGINVGLSSYINPGYKGKLPIVIHNLGSFDFVLTPNMRICQLVLSETNAVLSDYSRREDAKYHGETDITLSKLSEDKEFAEYVKSVGEKNPSKLIEFLRDRIAEKSQDFFANLSEEQKKAIGIA